MQTKTILKLLGEANNNGFVAKHAEGDVLVVGFRWEWNEPWVQIEWLERDNATGEVSPHELELKTGEDQSKTWKSSWHCQQQPDEILIRNENTDNYDVVATVPMTGDEEYDEDVTVTNANQIAATPVLVKLLDEVAASLDTVMCHYGKSMPESDFERRNGLVKQAQQLLAQIRG